MQFAGQTLHITFFTDATISTQWTRSGLYFLLLQQRFCVSRYGLETVIHATKVLTLNIEFDLMNWNFWPFKINMTNWTELSVILFSVLEPCCVLCNSIYHSCIVCGWSTGICDVWLHSLLPAPWTTIQRPSETSQGEGIIDNTTYILDPSSCSIEKPIGFDSSQLPFMQRYHLNHHFRIQDKGFGITSTLWDTVFGSLSPSTTGKKNWRT